MSRPISVLLLAAGCGTRLRPYTNKWPKCLMPINRKPLLEYWLDISAQIGAENVLVNTHYLASTVQRFLDRPVYKQWVRGVYEPELKGTAGTLRENARALRDSTILVAHADNFCQCNFHDFLSFHQTKRPKFCPITMMTFQTQSPHSCGIVELDKNKVVRNFYEKVRNPPGNLANGAVYLLEPYILDWICERPEITDFSTQVIPHFIGRVATWHNKGTHLDIGFIQALREAQTKASSMPRSETAISDEWSLTFNANPIHEEIRSGICTI